MICWIAWVEKDLIPRGPGDTTLTRCRRSAFDNIPLEVHKSALRKCVPDAKQLRVATARRMQAKNFPKDPHMFEERITEVMKNIRRAGGSLQVEDYHFILEQYAAVGHYMEH